MALKDLVGVLIKERVKKETDELKRHKRTTQVRQYIAGDFNPNLPRPRIEQDPT